MIESPLALGALVAGLTALGLWMAGRFAWAKKVSASLLIILLGAVVSNLGLVPASSPVYDVVSGPVTSLAIVWLLLAVDLRDMRAAGPRVLLAFGLAVVSTMVGTLAAMALLGGAFGDQAWRLAGAVTGTYSGGSLNFVAMARELGLEESLFVATTAADNVVTTLYMGVSLTLPVWLIRRRGLVMVQDGGQDGAPARPELKVVDLAMLLALGLMLMIGAERMAALVPLVPRVIWLSTMALIVAQLPPVRKLVGAWELGTLALNLFFVVMGLGSRLAEIYRVGLEVFYLTALVVLIHGVLTYGASRLLRLDASTTAVASQAAIGGPSTAMAVAVAHGWSSLTLPAMAVGLLGYAVGNYAGLIVAYTVRAMLGG